MFVGPIVAWVSSWILYAFGELVDKTCKNEQNTKAIVDLLQEEKSSSKSQGNYAPPPAQPEQKSDDVTVASPKATERVDNSSQSVKIDSTENGTMVCPLCNFEQPSNRKVCWHCGARFENDAAPVVHKWLCHNCKKMRSQSPCEHCGNE